MIKPIRIIFISAMACFLSVSARADSMVYSYQKHNPRTRQTVNEYDLTIEQLSDGKKKYQRTIVGKRSTKEEEFVLNTEFETVQWYTKEEDEGTEYKGSKEGRVIKLSGKLEGEELDRTIELPDEKPFYFSPKFNLTKFVLSDQEHIEFWMLRKDKLTEYLMEAEKKGEIVVEVDGKEIPAIKVRFAATGKGAKFYKRTYYFRKSDGMFVKRTALDGAVTELVSQ